MAQRLKHAGPRMVTAEQCKQWYIYTDASYETEQSAGGLGGVLIDETGEVRAWFSAYVDGDMCQLLGAAEKRTIIYELELLATVVATDLWTFGMKIAAQTYMCILETMMECVFHSSEHVALERWLNV